MRFLTRIPFKRISLYSFHNRMIMDSGNQLPTSTTPVDGKYRKVCLGGTFDRLHTGHKILLSEAVTRCASEIIVGVTDESMIQKKLLHELIQPTEVRITGVLDYLKDIAPNLIHRVEPISDPFGPAIEEEDIEMIVVSEETKKGADKINEIRIRKNLHPLIIHIIPLLEESTKESHHEEDKISSSSMRLRLLGQRLQPPCKPISIPYIIGLTGGSASGKSNICKFLEENQGIPTIDCDKLGHAAYKPGTSCFDKIVQTFGCDIITTENEIDRRSLGGKVFGNPEELKKLTDIVWPEIFAQAQKLIQQHFSDGKKIIILDAAVLLEAGWDTVCHEIWVTFVSRDEAIQRIQDRDKLPNERAVQRIDSQLSNEERLKKATFAFSSLWEPDFTRTQVLKALNTIKPTLETLSHE